MQDYRALIRVKRKEKGLSQVQLANMLGVTQSFVNQIESGKRNPRLEILMEMCKILEIPLFGEVSNHES